MAQIASDPFYSEGRLSLCYVYQLLCGDDKVVYVKIGMSQDPMKRALALRNVSPLPIDLMAVIDLGSRRLAMDVEGDLHKALDKWRTNGEWFRMLSSDKAEFKELTRAVLEEYETQSRPLNWTKINLKELAMQARKRRNLAQRRWQTRGLAYRDAVLAGIRR